MFVWSRTIATDLETVLEDLKRDAYEKTGVEYFSRIQRSGTDLFIPCPNYAAHGGVEERTPSCSVDTETGMFNCFGCGFSGSLPVLVAKVLNLSTPVQGYRWLLKTYSTPVRGERDLVPLDLSPRGNKKRYLPESILEPYNYDHPYMFKRGLTREVIDLFNLGYCIKDKAITIPMRDSKGRLIFIKKRPIQKRKFHKYHIEGGADKRDLLFGLNIVRENISRVKRLFICEGEFDVMSWYVVQEYAVGLQGSELFPEQVKELIKIAKGVPICLSFDNDLAGKKAKKQAVELLHAYFPLFEVIYPSRDYKDPNDLLLEGLLRDIPIRPIGLK